MLPVGVMMLRSIRMSFNGQSIASNWNMAARGLSRMHSMVESDRE
jgi:hypothetical protein